MERGLVKWYNDAKKYGFIISQEDGKEFLAYDTHIQNDPPTLKEYQIVEFERFFSDKGPEAHKINIVMTQDLSIYQHEFTSLKRQRLHLSSFVGHVLLVVNTASGCGLTPQFESLEKLYQKYKDRKFTILGFPSNNFANQEQLDDEAILNFCQTNYHISFPIMEKSNVVEFDRQSPDRLASDQSNRLNLFYRDLKSQTGNEPHWNFHKYLISKTGNEILSFDHMVDPLDDNLILAIENLLDKQI